MIMNAKNPNELAAKKQVLYGVSLLIGINDRAFEWLASLAAESWVSAGHAIVHQGRLRELGDEFALRT